MKIQIELNLPGNGQFLNYWNNINGDDVVCEIVDGKLLTIGYDEKGDELPRTEITVSQFVEKVIESYKKANE